MTGVIFEQQAPVMASDPNRADIACFVGFVARRPGTAIPAELERWLLENGWWEGPIARPSARRLLDVPVPIDAWETFDRLFAWERRVLDGFGHEGPTYLGAAVRSFFAEGGRKCYVVRVGRPWDLTLAREQRLERIRCLIPGYPHRVDAAASDRATWLGAGHLFGLPDVAMLCLPDLCDAVALADRRPRDADVPPPAEEQFVECSRELPAVLADTTRGRLLPAPRCDAAAYHDWAVAVNLLTRLVRDSRPRFETQVIAALPIPEDGSTIAGDFRRFLTDPREGVLSHRPESRPSGLASAFVQLVYPWLRTTGSAPLPDGVESPEGVMAGLLARNALTRGAYRSAAPLPLASGYDAFPALSRDQLAGVTAPPRPGMRVRHARFGPGSVTRVDDAVEEVEVVVRFDSGGTKTLLMSDPNLTPDGQSAGSALQERVSVFAMTPRGLRLRSDVTASPDETYRQASVNRLVSLVIRAARQLGDETAFETSGEHVWGQLRDRLNAMLLALLRAGALRGATAADAFHVRCDRSTMTQNDLDNGRAVVEIQFAPTIPVETIRVVLALDEGGQVEVLAAPREDAA
jgi:hypothetical protein